MRSQKFKFSNRVKIIAVAAFAALLFPLSFTPAQADDAPDSAPFTLETEEGAAVETSSAMQGTGSGDEELDEEDCKALSTKIELEEADEAEKEAFEDSELCQRLEAEKQAGLNVAQSGIAEEGDATETGDAAGDSDIADGDRGADGSAADESTGGEELAPDEDIDAGDGFESDGGAEAGDDFETGDDAGLAEDELTEDEEFEEESFDTGKKLAEDEADTPGKVKRDITPFATATTTIKITKVGDRNGTTTTSGAPLAGAVFNAYAATSNSTTPPSSGASIGSCTTDTAGKCDIVVENNYTNGVWVKETSAPAGWLPITAIGTGAYNSAKTATPYVFRVPVGTGNSNQTRNLTADANLPNQQRSNVWVNSRVNPGFPEVCGVDIALVFDTSASIDSGEMTQFKNAARNFLGTSALGGTPSNVSMFRFDTRAQTMNGGAAYNLSFAGSGSSNTGYQGAQAMVNTLPSQGNSNGYTNWDDALRLVNASGSFDMVLFLTDGDPTTYGTGTQTSTNVQFLMVEQAVLSANALKASVGPSGINTKIVGVGVGLSANSYLSLAAVTGPVQGQDYFLASDFNALNATLQEIANKNCAGTLTVVKEVQDAAGNVVTQSASDWEFTATGSVVKDGEETRITTPSGTNFDLEFPVPGQAVVKVVETPQGGSTFYSASCTGAAGPATVITNGFTVPIASGNIASCKVINRTSPVKVSATKQWQITDAAGTVIRTAHIPALPTDDDLPNGLQAVVSISGPGSDAPVPRDWGAEVDGFAQGATAKIAEQASVNQQLLPGCSLESSLVTSVNGSALSTPAALPYTATLTAATTNVEITNKVKCSTQLILLKEVEGGSALPAEWNLLATPTAGGAALTAPGSATANAANTLEIADGADYLLGEELASSSTSLAYRFDRLEKCDLVSGSCVWNEVAIDDQVSVELGQSATYRFVNVPMPVLTMPLSGGLGADWFYIAGIGFALAAAAAALVTMRSNKRLKKTI